MIPINIEVKNRKIVIIGGGKVAEKRAVSFLENEALVHIIAPEATSKIREYSQNNKVIWKRRVYQKDDLDGAFIGILAVNNQKVEEEFLKEAREKNLLVCVSSDYKKGNFIFPATAQKGKILIGVSTGGAFPLLSAEILEDLENMVGQNYQLLVDYLAQVRDEVKQRYPKKKREIILKRVFEKRKFIKQSLGKGRKPTLEQILNHKE